MEVLKKGEGGRGKKTLPLSLVTIEGKRERLVKSIQEREANAIGRKNPFVAQEKQKKGAATC